MCVWNSICWRFDQPSCSTLCFESCQICNHFSYKANIVSVSIYMCEAVWADFFRHIRWQDYYSKAILICSLKACRHPESIAAFTKTLSKTEKDAFHSTVCASLTETLSKLNTENSMKITVVVATNKYLNIVRSHIYELQAAGIWSSVSTLLCLCRSSVEGRYCNPMVYSWHLELWCQPHSYSEPDSLVNWHSFHLLDRNMGILRVTYCTAADVYVSVFEMWDGCFRRAYSG